MDVLRARRNSVDGSEDSFPVASKEHPRQSKSLDFEKGVNELAREKDKETIEKEKKEKAEREKKEKADRAEREKKEKQAEKAEKAEKKLKEKEKEKEKEREKERERERGREELKATPRRRKRDFLFGRRTPDHDESHAIIKLPPMQETIPEPIRNQLPPHRKFDIEGFLMELKSRVWFLLFGEVTESPLYFDTLQKIGYQGNVYYE